MFKFDPKAKEREAEERRAWIKEHTFKYGESVLVYNGDNVFVTGTIKGFGNTRGNDYCPGEHYYVVDYGDGILHKISASELKHNV